MHIDKMYRLTVQALRLPGRSEWAVFVTDNGHHRSLDYKLMHLPVVRANVTVQRNPQWMATPSNKALIYYLSGHGLAQDLESDRDGFTTFTDTSGALAWILPDSAGQFDPFDRPVKLVKPVQVAAEMGAHLSALESVVGHLGDQRLDIIRHRRRLAWGLRRYYKSLGQ